MTGTITNPAKFADVISSPRVIAGDTFVLRGGTYKGDWVVTVKGTAEKPLTFKPHEGEQVIISGSLTLQGGYTEWQNITIQQSDAAKPAVYMTQPGTKLTNCDISGGFIGVEWYGSGAGALIRCKIHDTASYGIYTHNNNGGAREVTDCTFTNIGGSYSIHIYSTGVNAIRDYIVSGCTVDKPVIVHGSEITNTRFINNHFRSRLVLGNGRTIQDMRQVVVTGNRFTDALDLGIHAVDCSDLEITSNDFATRVSISLQRNANEQRTVIDGNHYVGGWFVLEDVYNVSFASWQAAGFDANGTFTE